MTRHPLLIGFVTVTVVLAACDGGPFAGADAIRQKATQSLVQKNFTDAANLADDLIKKAPESSEGYFLLAQAKVQLDEKNAALAALESAIKKGYKDEKSIEANPNLKPLRDLPAYAALMDSAFPKRESPATETASSTVSAGDVGIVQTDTKTVIHAGDVVVELPNHK
jgi:thioredoxin-like negative regulator of GroEL